MKPTDPADLPRDDSGAAEQAEQPQAAAVEQPTETALLHPEQPAPSTAPTVSEMAARMMAGFPGRFVPGPGETASAETGPSSLWAGLESAEKLAKLLFFEPGAVIELRAINSKGREGRVCSGYFDSPLEFLRAAATRDGSFDGLYATLNRVDPELIARAINRVKNRADATTKDCDITERRWCLIDVDPVRPSGISSTDEEHAHALEVSAAIAAELAELGWPAPVRADSGNGGHLLYRIGEGCDDGPLLERCLKALAMQFDSEQSIVDTSVTKRAQISKLYGSMACKGDSTAERPHRRSALLDVPDEIVPVTREQLEALAGRLPADRDPAPRYALPTSKGHQPDVPAMLASAGLEVRRYSPWDGKEKWVLETCPWNPSHGPGKAWVLRFPSGALAAGCLHSGCAGRNWQDLKQRFYPSAKTSSASAPRTDSSDAPHAVPANVDAAAATLSDWGEQDGLEYAHASAAVPARADASRQETQPRMRRPGQFLVGDLVRPSDRENQGTVIDIERDGYLVQFVNTETGYSAEVSFKPYELTLLRPVSESKPIVVLSTADVLNLVPSPWLIEGVLRQGELAVMFGAPGCGKSLIALDMALCITQGRPWCEHATAASRVLYIAAEGQGGLMLRLLAWNEGQRPDVDAESWKQFHVVAEPVQIADGQLPALIDAVDAKAKGVKLMVIDTVARTAVGLEENSAKDMGKYVHAADQLRKQTGATVLLVHHSAKNRDDERLTIRGSSALTAAVDTQIAVAPGPNHHVTVTCEKQKDAPDFDPKLMRIESVDLSEALQADGVTGGRVVFVESVAAQGGKHGKRGRRGEAEPGETESKIVQTLKKSFRGEWVSSAVLIETAEVKRATFHKVRQDMVKRGVIEQRSTKRGFEFRLPDLSPSSTSNVVQACPTGSASPLDPPSSLAPCPVGAGHERDDRGMGIVHVSSEVER